MPTLNECCALGWREQEVGTEKTEGELTQNLKPLVGFPTAPPPAGEGSTFDFPRGGVRSPAQGNSQGEGPWDGVFPLHWRPKDDFQGLGWRPQLDITVLFMVSRQPSSHWVFVWSLRVFGFPFHCKDASPAMWRTLMTWLQIDHLLKSPVSRYNMVWSTGG